VTDVETNPVGRLDLEVLGAYLAEVVGGFDGPLRARLFAGGRSNPTYALTDDARQWVLRRPPYGLVLKSAHDMGREVTVLQALRDTAVPAPAVVAFEAEGSVLGAPFYIMDHINGVTIADREQALALTPGERRRLGESVVDTLATLHAIDPAEVGLEDWGDRSTSGSGRWRFGGGSGVPRTPWSGRRWSAYSTPSNERCRAAAATGSCTATRSSTTSWLAAPIPASWWGSSTGRCPPWATR
jgi:hypothetical protein